MITSTCRAIALRCHCTPALRTAPIVYHLHSPLSRRAFSATAIGCSGHSRWSKIKHDKARVDAKVNKQRSLLARDIEAASREGGSDPNTNPRLASVLAAAKKAGFPKHSCEAAVARGQGRSPSGAILETMVVEILHSPTGVAGVVDCLTDNKAKTLQQIREKLKDNGASQAPVGYMFERRGRVRFADGVEEGERSLEEEAVMEAALSAGALEIEFSTESKDAADSEGPNEAIIYTAPTEMAAVASGMSAELGSKPREMELVWVPKADMMVGSGEGPDWEQFGRLIDRLEDDWTVTNVAVNAK